MRPVFFFPMRLVLLAAAAAAAPVRFVVLKRGHSGSTWFSALLQELHLTFFMDEALSAKALAGASRDDVAKYLDAALAAPAGQFQSSARPKPIQWRAQSRRAERCHVRRRGCDLAAVGLGVAPLARRRRTAPPDWFAAVLAAAAPKVVVWLRTNVVKMVFATHGRKGALVAHRRLARAEPAAFLRECRSGVARNAALAALAAKLPSTKTVFYEAVQRDAAREMNAVRRFLGLPKRTTNFTTASVKRGADDLRTVLPNFDDLSAALAGDPCLRAMLHARAPVVFPPCNSSTWL